MKNKFFISIFLIFSVVLAGCSTSDTKNLGSKTVISEENSEVESKTGDTETTTEQKANVQEPASIEPEADMKNVALSTVPDGYYSNAAGYVGNFYLRYKRLYWKWKCNSKSGNRLSAVWI